MNTTILEQGLHIIAHSKSATGDIWHAHFGAAAIAACFFIEENGVSLDTAQRIQQQVEAMLQAKSLPATNVSAPIIHSATAEHRILESLATGIDDLHWVGHNVIYAALSLKAIRERNGWNSEATIHGICALIESFNKTIPGRSWIGYSVAEVKRLEITEHDQFPVITTAEQLSKFVLNELASYPAIYQAEAHHDLIGHMLTFSHALNILFDLGYSSYSERALTALFKVVKVLRGMRDLKLDKSMELHSPVDHWPLVQAKRSAWMPIEKEYWSVDYAKYDWDFGHVFKFPFSFYHHLNRAREEMESAVENFRYVICSE